MSTDVVTFAAAETTVRYKEPFLTEGLNKKLAVVVPSGIYRGFKIQPDPGAGSLTIQIAADDTHGDHVLQYLTDTGYALTLRRETGSFLISLAAYASTTVVIAVYATYAIGATTESVLRVYTAAEFAVAAEKDEAIVLGTVVVPGSGVITSSKFDYSLTRWAWKDRATGDVSWTQIVRNGSFEWGDVASGNEHEHAAAFWRMVQNSQGAWKLSTTDPYSGAMSAELEFLAAGNFTGSLVQQVNIPVVPGQRYRVRFRKKMVQGATNGYLQLVNTMLGPTGAALIATSVSLDTTVDATYEEYDATFVVQSGAYHLKEVGVNASAFACASAGAAIRIDDFQVFVEPADVLDIDAAKEIKGADVLTSVVLRDPNGDFSDLESLVTFDKDTPAGEGRVTVDRRDQQSSGAALPPAIELLGRLYNLGGSLLNSKAQARMPRVGAPFDLTLGEWYSLLIECPDVGGGTGATRIYIASNTFGPGLVITSNAEWDGANWSQDDATKASWQLLMRTGGFALRTKNAGGAPWTDGTFDNNLMTLATAITAGVQNAFFGGGVNVGGGMLSSSALAQTPRLQMSSVDRTISGQDPTKTLIAEFLPPSFSGVRYAHRLYMVDASLGEPALELVTNAKWDNSTQLWTRDNLGYQATKYVIDHEGFQFLGRGTGAATFDDSPGSSGWNGATTAIPFTLFYNWFLDDHILSIVNATSGGSNPPDTTTPYANSLYAKNIVKAWGSITTGGGSPVVRDGFNIQEQGYSGSPADVDIRFRTALDDSNYTVVAQRSSTAGLVDLKHAQVSAQQSIGFYLQCWSSAVVHEPLDSSVRIINFIVLGHDTS